MTKSVKITIALLLLACVIIAAFPLLSVCLLYTSDAADEL